MQLAAKADIPAVACSGMVEVVAAARGAASTGDTVLLSPACSSLDMFASFAERGNQFAAAVRDLDEAVC
jgi:UDP-N-acetylmuramoylalanine--D-glutamate ligase